MKDINDKYIRENFSRITAFLKEQTILDGEFEFFLIDIPSAMTFDFQHNLGFVPKDVITLALSGNKNVDFRLDIATKNILTITTQGPVSIRCLIGAYRLKRQSTLTDLIQVPVSSGGGSPGPMGPPGPTGPPGPSGTSLSAPRILAPFSTDAGTVATNLVRINAANTVTKITDNLAATIPNGIFGIGYFKPSSVLIDVIVCGTIGGFSGFTPGLPLFISTAGIPTHTPPTTGMVQQIGFAVSSTDLFVNLMQAMRRA